ncbi:MAG: hypothetical protein ACRD7E_14640, partial [Bryobacteraceae bacterium]
MRFFFPLLLLLATLPVLAEEGEPEEEGVAHRLPKLSSVFPQGAEPGSKLQVEIIGEYLDRAQSAVFLQPGVQARIVDDGFTRLKLELEVDADAQYGEHYFRIFSPRGVSNLILFRVGDQPHVMESEPNSDIEQAQQVSLPLTINARLTPDGDFDFYRFEAKARDTWTFDLRSARNGNSLDAALILLDSKGTRITYSEDKFIWDPFLVHRFEKAGTYVAVVQPTHRNLDPSFAYQLDIKKTPYLETISPISVAPGSSLEATLYGAGLMTKEERMEFDAPGFAGELLDARGDSARVRLNVPENAREGKHELVLTG